MMKSTENLNGDDSDGDYSVVDQLQDAIHNELNSINIHSSMDNQNNYSFEFLRTDETFVVPNLETFCKQMKCRIDQELKVISIFGKTGDGKSHTLNKMFFRLMGSEVFKTTSEQNSCTMGVWAAFDPQLKILCLDTEGIPGNVINGNQRTRMLLKILAISDIVIYRTRSEKLHDDNMFEFLGNASKGYTRHLSQALSQQPNDGPAIVIFHETRDTNVLTPTVQQNTEEIIQRIFNDKGYSLNAFRRLKYIGIKTTPDSQTDYVILENKIKVELEFLHQNKRKRLPADVFESFKILNNRFQGRSEVKIKGKSTDSSMSIFSYKILTCGVHCEVCPAMCQESMGHHGQNHRHEKTCVNSPQYENKVFICRNCERNDKKIVVQYTTQTMTHDNSSWYNLAKTAWTGSVIICPNCREIYRSKWFDNKGPEESAVRAEFVHVWRGGDIIPRGPTHSAQMVLDGISFVKDTVYSYTQQPTKAISNWATDQVAPTYWKPNHKIIICLTCKDNFEKLNLSKHHCRLCGEGFCNKCTQTKMPVPEKGWDEPVRVCAPCCRNLTVKTIRGEIEKVSFDENNSAEINPNEIAARKYGEVVINTLSPVAGVIEYAKDFVKDKARPEYWIPDEQSPNCSNCNKKFGKIDNSPTTSEKSKQIEYRRHHHCRSCGRAVCNLCSLKRRPVPERGWTSDVRICDECCIEKKEKRI